MESVEETRWKGCVGHCAVRGGWEKVEDAKETVGLRTSYGISRSKQLTAAYGVVDRFGTIGGHILRASDAT